MKYAAEVTNKTITSGLLQVQVCFRSEDGSDIVNDCFETRSVQDAKWLQNNIDRKCKELEGLSSFIDTITIGEVVVVEETPVTPVLTAKEEYKSDLAKFNKLVGILRQGFIEQDNAEFVALQAKLKTNFSPDYIDLF